MPQDETEEIRDAQPTAGAPGGLGAALRTCLAPLALHHALDGAVGYVLHGTGPEVLAELDDLRSTQREEMVPLGGNWPGDRVAAVVDLHPGWSPQAADDARLLVYRDAPADALARFGQLLDAIGVPERVSPGRWLATLTSNVVKATTSRSTASQEVRTRWTPDFVSEVARAGDAPGRTPVHATLATLLHVGPDSGPTRRDTLLATDAGDTFLARHADVLAEVVTAAGRGQRHFVALRCARNAERHAGPLAVLAVDEDRLVRAVALAVLAWLDESRQVEVLRPHLRTTVPDRLAGVLRRLADVDGGLAAIEDALTASDGNGAEDP